MRRRLRKELGRVQSTGVMPERRWDETREYEQYVLARRIDEYGQAQDRDGRVLTAFDMPLRARRLAIQRYRAARWADGLASVDAWADPSAWWVPEDTTTRVPTPRKPRGGT